MDEDKDCTVYKYIEEQLVRRETIDEIVSLLKKDLNRQVKSLVDFKEDAELRIRGLERIDYIRDLIMRIKKIYIEKEIK